MRVSGGFGPHQDGKFQRNVYKVDVSKFWGRHEIKGGVDWEDVDSEVNRYEGGAGQRISRLRSSAATGSQIYYRHRFFIDDTVAGLRSEQPRDVRHRRAADGLAGHTQHVLLCAGRLESGRRI